MPNFEKFRRSNITSGAVPMVSIHLRGIMALNEQAQEALGKPDAIELFYDREDRIVGMKSAPRSSPDAYAVRHHAKHSSQIAGQSFLEFYEIPQNVRGRRYKAEKDGDFLTVDLTQDPEE
ncbi:MAG: hypothetical protein ACR2G1_10390 [Rubrobacteraceae bacterium]